MPVPPARNILSCCLPFAVGLVACLFPCVAMAAVPCAPSWEEIEADWVLQETIRAGVQRTSVSRSDDAAGACDGVKDGKWGFHTGRAKEPWWQVDLGKTLPLDRVVVFNRCDGSASRANSLSVLLSDDGKTWHRVYTHNGGVFGGHPDGKPLSVSIVGKNGRFVRLQIPGDTFLHLDEAEVYATADPSRNIALNQPADQVSTSQWSTPRLKASTTVQWAARTQELLSRVPRLLAEVSGVGEGTARELHTLADLRARNPKASAPEAWKAHYLIVRRLIRRLMLRHPLLNFDDLLVTKRVPGTFCHMSDQYYGWWSSPGGGIHVLRSFASDTPSIIPLTENLFDAPGNVVRPMISHDGRRVLFSWCRYYPTLSQERNKLAKGNVPEDAFYHVFEMNIDGTGLRQLTRGKYDDFDARYLADNRIVFLSTRRGQAIQCGQQSASATTASPALPDCYVRCGGGASRPVAVYTLHTMDGDGSNLYAISPFEMFEWTPAISHDGSILYSRWDYIDRHNMPYMGLWAINPDGTNSRLVYGNFTKSPHCSFEPRPIPNSHKIVFTASAHHAQTMGSLVLFDPRKGNEGSEPLTRLTPEVVFPEIEGWPTSYYANPWPLSEDLYLVSWSPKPIGRQSNINAPNALGVYLFHVEGTLELLHRDPDISTCYPIPIASRKRPPVYSPAPLPNDSVAGRFLVLDVQEGLSNTQRGDVSALRIIAVPAKTQPNMNRPVLGLTRDDPGKCLLGTVPVEADGSALFHVPAGVIVFFQALGKDGMAIQTMRSATHVQPGQTLTCVGCHESRYSAPPVKRSLAAVRPPSRIRLGPEGAWPLRFDRLVQPVLDASCVRCHRPGSPNKAAAALDLTPKAAYRSLVAYGKPSLRDHVKRRYSQSKSLEGQCVARSSALFAKLRGAKGHHGVVLDASALERLTVWMDLYAHDIGSFSKDQEKRLISLRERSRPILVER